MIGRPITSCFTSALAAFIILGSTARALAATPPESGYIFGVLQASPATAAADHARGIRLVTLELGWDRAEPTEGNFNEAYFAEQKRRLRAFRAAGMQVVLDLGVQYPPRWLFTLSNSRYINQFHDQFVDDRPGMNGVNAVFNEALRQKQAAYIHHIFQSLGRDFFAVRLGLGWYSELNFPPNKFAGHENCYWAFDDLAQGRAPGLPVGVKPCPVPGYIPGTPSPNHEAARKFLNWYLASLQNYHDWQIRTVRQWYPGRLAMLYPSWGVRPGQLDAAIAVDLNGSTSPEKNGEIQRGFDFARFIAGIRDPNLIVYTTWLGAGFADEDSPDPARWSPAHYLSSLAAANPLHLKMWGENTGSDTAETMNRCFQQMKDYHLIGLMWAFRNQLDDPHFATWSDFQGLIAQSPP